MCLLKYYNFFNVHNRKYSPDATEVFYYWIGQYNYKHV